MRNIGQHKDGIVEAFVAYYRENEVEVNKITVKSLGDKCRVYVYTDEGRQVWNVDNAGEVTLVNDGQELL
jgi:hypothetical protein